MPIEAATYINDLVPANPLSNDPFADGDNHIRLVKQVLKNTFPNANEAITHTHTVLNRIAGVNANASELNRMKNATVTTAEINRLAGVTVNVQARIDSVPPKWTFMGINAFFGGNYISPRPYYIYAFRKQNADSYLHREIFLQAGYFEVGQKFIVCAWSTDASFPPPYIRFVYDVQIVGAPNSNSERYINFSTTPKCFQFTCVEKLGQNGTFVITGDSYTIASSPS